jgi:hypothetical protein
VRGAASTAAGTRSYALPTSYLSGRVFSLNTTPITPLEYLTPEMMDRLWAGSTSGKPLTYTIVGDNYHLGPAPDAVYTVEIIYYKQVDALSDAAPSNTMLTNNPDVYLYGALLEATRTSRCGKVRMTTQSTTFKKQTPWIVILGRF